MKRFKVFLLTAYISTLLLAAVALAGDQKPAAQPENVPPTQPVGSGPSNAASSAAFQLNWLSINGGGAINATSTTYKLGLSVGQSVAGACSSATFKMGIGFWYGAGSAPACAAAKGDLDGSTLLDATDVVLMLNCVFLGDGSGTLNGTCDLCFTDVDCTGGVGPDATDVVQLLNKVFLGDPFIGC